MRTVIRGRGVAVYLGLISAIIFFGQNTFAQETEGAAESRLLEVMLPTGAQRVLPASVPAEVSQTLEKVISGAGKGKFRQGGSEVLVWAGGDYNKSKASPMISQLIGSIKGAGWQYAVEGSENGVTVFGAVKANSRQAVLGFYGATDDALVVAISEIVPIGGTAATETTQGVAGDTTPATVRQNGSIVGSWSNGAMSLIGYKPQVGGTFTPGRSHVFKYNFLPDGTFEFTGLMQLTNYGCTSQYFQDKRGRFSIDGDRITLSINKNFWRSTNSCLPSSNKEINHKLDPESYTLRTGLNSNGKPQVCLTAGDGETCYERSE